MEIVRNFAVNRTVLKLKFQHMTIYRLELGSICLHMLLVFAARGDQFFVIRWCSSVLVVLTIVQRAQSIFAPAVAILSNGFNRG